MRKTRKHSCLAKLRIISLAATRKGVGTSTAVKQQVTKDQIIKNNYLSLFNYLYETFTAL